MRALRTGAAYALTVVILGWLMLGCGASAREKTLHAMTVSTEAAQVAFVTYDKQHQEQLIEQAKDKPAAVAALADYRARQAKVETMFGVLYRALATAAVLDADPNLKGVEQAAAVLMAELRALKVIP